MVGIYFLLNAPFNVPILDKYKIMFILTVVIYCRSSLQFLYVIESLVIDHFRILRLSEVL